MQYLISDLELDIPEIYKVIGRLAEERVKLYLSTQLSPTQTLSVEEPIKYHLDDNWQLSGRKDFVIRDTENSGNNTIWEVKASISSYMRFNTLTRGVINADHLGQLITYLITSEVSKGVLSYSYLSFTEDLLSLTFDVRNFKVEIRNNKIFVDNVLYNKHTINTYMKFYTLMRDSVEQSTLPAQTINARACLSCPFQIVCENNPGSKEEFVNLFNDLGVATKSQNKQVAIPVQKCKKKKD